MNRQTIFIQGMHCTSCEMLIEDELKNLSEVHSAQVNFRTGTAVIQSNKLIPEKELHQAVQNAGYHIGQPARLPWFSRNQKVQQHLVTSISILVIGFFVLNYFGLFNTQVSHQAASSSLPVIFIVGLTAGFSTCMALIGGLVLGLAAKFSQSNRDATTVAKFRPHLMFNFGRVVAYFVLGALLGYVGSFLTLSSVAIGALTIIVAVVMLLLGLQLTEISPRLAAFKLTLPKFFSRAFSTKIPNSYSDIKTICIGALTFFLPCGFTQTMQLYALSIADPARSAMIMGVFALGTTPGLLGVGGLTALVKGTYAQPFFRFAGVLVAVLSFINIQNAFTLLGVTTPQVKGAQVAVQNSNSNTMQYLRATYTLEEGLTPNNFDVQVGMPVQLAVEVKEDGVGCMSTMLIPGVANMPRYLKGGTTLTFEFTPQKARNFNIVCAMGLPHGIIQAS